MTAVRAHKRRKVGTNWSIVGAGFGSGKGAGNDVAINFTPTDKVVFDDLFVDAWLRCEQMDSRLWWLRVGELHLWARFRQDGRVEVSGYIDAADGTKEIPTHVTPGPWWREAHPREVES